MSAESRSQRIIEDNDAARKAAYFSQIERGKTAEYKRIISDLDAVFPAQEQKNRALNILRSGRAMTASEARTIMQSEDFDDRNTYR